MTTVLTMDDLADLVKKDVEAVKSKWKENNDQSPTYHMFIQKNYVTQKYNVFYEFQDMLSEFDEFECGGPNAFDIGWECDDREEFDEELNTLGAVMEELVKNDKEGFFAPFVIMELRHTDHTGNTVIRNENYDSYVSSLLAFAKCAECGELTFEELQYSTLGSKMKALYYLNTGLTLQNIQKVITDLHNICHGKHMGETYRLLMQLYVVQLCNYIAAVSPEGGMSHQEQEFFNFSAEYLISFGEDHNMDQAEEIYARSAASGNEHAKMRLEEMQRA